MPRFKTTSKYSIERSAEIKYTALEVLENTTAPLTLDELRAADMKLIGVTNQKISRELSSLIDVGIVSKTKKGGKVAYKVV